MDLKVLGKNIWTSTIMALKVLWKNVKTSTIMTKEEVNFSTLKGPWKKSFLSWRSLRKKYLKIGDYDFAGSWEKYLKIDDYDYAEPLKKNNFCSLKSPWIKSLESWRKIFLKIRACGVEGLYFWKISSLWPWSFLRKKYLKIDHYCFGGPWENINNRRLWLRRSFKK